MGCCDVVTVIANIVVGDRASTVVKAFVYCLRIRLEVDVLLTMSVFLKSKMGSIYSPNRSNFHKFFSTFRNPSRPNAIHEMGLLAKVPAMISLTSCPEMRSQTPNVLVTKAAVVLKVTNERH